MHILLTGANGMLGRSVEEIIKKQYASIKLYSTDLKNLDITQFYQLNNFFSENKIDIIINCAAYANVDGCENAPEIAYSVNSTAVGYLAELAYKYSAKLCHISTDYVYAQKQECSPFTEESECAPLSVYGKSKLAGEQKVTETLKDFFILRTSWMFGYNGENFLKWVASTASQKPLKLICDSFGCPTYSIHLAEFILKVINTDKYGIYNFSNSGLTNWYEFGMYIVSSAQIKGVIFEKVKAADLKRAAARPNYSVMSIQKIIDTFNYTPPDWRTAVDECLEILRK